MINFRFIEKKSCDGNKCVSQTQETINLLESNEDERNSFPYFEPIDEFD